MKRIGSWITKLFVESLVALGSLSPVCSIDDDVDMLIDHHDSGFFTTRLIYRYCLGEDGEANVDVNSFKLEI
jgi:hypothetical protein